MSIQAEIAARIGEGRLTRLVPQMVGFPSVRQVLMTPAVLAALDGPWTTKATARLFGQARARLEAFIRGDLIVGRVPPSKSVNTVIALLTPAIDNVWEFRIGEPRPGVRIFGRFAERDVFIATNAGARQDFLNPTTGKDDRRRWRNAIITSKTEWANLFPAYQPLIGNTLHDYISNSRLPV